MKKTRFLLSSLITAGLLAACSEIPKDAYRAPGQPERLMEVTEKDIHFDISGDSLKRIQRWAAQAHPTEASLSCTETSKACNKLEAFLHKQHISTTRVYAKHNEVRFKFKHVAMRECENRYVDNMINPYNLNHPTFGCSLAMNSAMMITDRTQLIEPPYMDKDDAVRGIQVIGAANTPPKADTNFTPLTTSESISSGGR